MQQFTVRRIGTICADDEGFRIVLEDTHAPALEGLYGFSHLQVLWWFSGCDDAVSRGTLRQPCPYRDGPEALGTFATRSPLRPNPIGLSCVQVVGIDEARGIVYIAWTDAEDGTPVLDLKPYTPSLDRVEHPETPAWCGHWPVSLEASADFDWERVFR